MLYSFNVITPPTTEPVTTELVRLHAHISHTAEDDLLELWIKSARKLAEAYQARAFVTQTLEMSFDRFPKLPLSLARSPLQSVVSVRYFDKENNEFTIDSDEFLVDTDSEPGRICFNDGYQWPNVYLRAINSVKIRFVAGYGDTAEHSLEKIPENVAHAIMIYCAFHDDNRAAELAAVPEQFYNLLSHDRVVWTDN